MTAPVYQGDLPTGAEVRAAVRRASAWCGAAVAAGLAVGVVLQLVHVDTSLAAQVGSSVLLVGVVGATWSLGRRARPLGRREVLVAGSARRVRRLRRHALRRNAPGLEPDDLRVRLAWAPVARARSGLVVPLLAWVFGSIAVLNLALLPDSESVFSHTVHLIAAASALYAIVAAERERRAVRRFVDEVDRLEGHR